jgi:predicted transcriptional regulator
MEQLELSLNEPQVLKILKVLASETRRRILVLCIITEGLDICEIAEKLHQTEANISAQIKILEKANLMKSSFTIGKHGVKKTPRLVINKITINLNWKAIV